MKAKFFGDPFRSKTVRKLYPKLYPKLYEVLNISGYVPALTPREHTAKRSILN
jgi:hypothetical protein